MGYSNVQGDLNVYSSTSTNTLEVRTGATIGTLSVSGPSTFGVLTAANLTVTGNFSVTATNTQVTNALSINNAGTATALKVVQFEGGGGGHTHNVAEFWDFQTLSMVIDMEGNVAIHAGGSPNYAFTVGDTAYIDNLTVGLITGNGSGLANLQTTSLVGPVTALQLETNQTNITSVGTLTSLAVTDSATAGWFVGSGNTLSNLNSSNLAFGTLSVDNIYSSNSIQTTNIICDGFTSNSTDFVLNFDTLSIPYLYGSTITVSNEATAGWFIGSGNTLSNLNASNLAFGLINSSLIQGNTIANIAFANVSGLVTGNVLSNLNASNLAFGNLNGSWVLGNTLSNLNASNIAFGNAPALSVTGNLTAGWFVGGANTLSNLNASNIAFGNLNGSWVLGNTLSNINASNIAFGNAPALSVTGNLTAGWHVGGANTLSNINASNIAFGNAPALSVTGNLNAGWHVGGANTLSNINASNIAFGNAPALSVTGNINAGWFVGGGNTLSNINASNIAIGALSSSQLQSTQANISAIGTVGTGLTVSGPLGITNLVITGGSTPTVGQYLQATSTGGALTWATVTTGGVTGNTISNINASNVVLGYFGNILTLANTASWFDLPAFMNVYQVYQTRAGSISVSGASFATALTFNNSLYVPPGVVGKMVVVYSTGSGTLESTKTNSTYVLSAGGGRIEIPNLSAGDVDPLKWSLRYFGGTTSSITYTDLWFEAYSTQIMSSNVVFGNAAASYTNVVMYSNLTVNGSIQSLVDASASNAMTVGTGIRLYGANSTIISTTAVATANLNATNGAVICAFPTRKFYSWSGVVTSSSAPTFTLTFANYAFYTKIVAILMDTSGTVNSVSTLSIEAAGGSADGTTPSNSIVIGSKNLFGPTLTNPWSATVTTSATTIVLVPTNSSLYSWQISAEVIGSSAALNTLAQSANPATSKTFNY
ncbi:hypothetical protein AR679_gp162 [Yellowstone lake phycodnavirus 1]|uniref:hypothetical protein n=1 Tax=Yellowstone lake phycodnavirus 1 TaxID=1586713 RepID=UPI0006EBAB0C|nr:hypothetical protein AR679_gp162 [Yellowstone lake phycodnavirus 1]BAT22188.1 hypothetical protein [Yellowstone lake phycodnavirus 1]